MPRSTPGRHRLAVLVGVLAIVAGTQALLAPSVDAAVFVPISGSGSTWSENALDQWRRNVATNYGITVNYSPNGSTSGRNDFRYGQVDFAVSEIPYGLTDGGTFDPPPTRKFGYMPIVAGGTSLMYNLKIGNNRVTNLRLSGETITKIFTQRITNWSDPQIKADNPGLTLPAIKIVPVVYSNGAGTSAQFTAWMAGQYPALWDDYCHRAGRKLTPCGFTSFYPLGNSDMVAKAQSQGVSGFVAQDSSAGAITYVEYSYARNAGFPVAKMLNKANYYVEPTAGSVAVALLKAQIHPDLTQDLSQVYVDPDPRAYPLSSYSYMIIPKDTTANFDKPKGATLSTFASYFLCEGQQQADILGYSPLPVNLVQDGVDQINQIPVPDGYTRTLNRNNLSGCHNPTVAPDGGNLVAENAPRPAPCDLNGPTQCVTGTGGAKQSTPTSGGSGGAGATAGAAGGGSGGGSGGAAAGGAGGTDGTASGGANGVSAAGTSPIAAASGTIDPDTGKVIGGSTSTSDSGASAVPVSVDIADNRRQMVLAGVAAVLLFGLILGPPLVASAMRSRAGSPDGPPP
ncbi:MAG: phosphate ABC transporter substrate-binding protein PstS [Pseudonocardiales bacterium]|nr:phosphate ABC transporter substrate-binding protein PstS [Pseudonocardiales bacterium]MBV9030095.1 phosphate ABC transporter substrate-binding protein PstS [Pseudonocardiales bacterium]